jgi:MoxR-like ATPase
MAKKADASDNLFNDDSVAAPAKGKRKNYSSQIDSDAPRHVQLIAALLDSPENSIPNKTFGKVAQVEELLEVPALGFLASYLAFPIPGSGVRLLGGPGTGKSANANTMAKLAGLRTEIIPAAEMKIEDLCIPTTVTAVSDDEDKKRTIVALRQKIYEKYVLAECLIIEELARAHGVVQQAFMELLASWTLNGQPLPNLKAIVVCDNDASEESADGSGGFIRELDPAMLDRVYTLPVDDNSTNWRRFLASKYPNIDLSDVYRLRDLMPPKLRRRLSPRTLEHVLCAVQNNLPFEWALPIVNNRRELLADGTRDYTPELAAAVAKAFGLPGNPKGPEGPEKFRQVIKIAVANGVNARFISAPGFGKTASGLDILKNDLNQRVVYMSGAAVSPDNLFVPVVESSSDTVKVLLDQNFANPEPFVLILDEFSRIKPEVKPKFYGLLQERRLGGIDVNMRAAIAFDNPGSVGGSRTAAGQIERAAADRFWFTVELSPSDTEWAAHLVRTHGETAEIVVEWWKTVLPSEAGIRVSARACERLIHAHDRGWPLRTALVRENGSTLCEEFLGSLENLFAKRTVPRLAVVVENVDRYEVELGSDQDCQRQTEVFLALLNAELPSLESARAVCVRMMRVLHEQHSVSLLRSLDKQRFWLDVLLEARGNGANKK